MNGVDSYINEMFTRVEIALKIMDLPTDAEKEQAFSRLTGNILFEKKEDAESIESRIAEYIKNGV
jgi:hypothetical protein